MSFTRTFLTLLSTIHSLLDPAVVRQLHHSKTRVCDRGNPELVYYEQNLSEPLDRILAHYLRNTTQPQAIFTSASSYLRMTSYVSCLLLFMENGSLVPDLIFATEHLKLIVTSEGSFDRINSLFIDYKIYDAVFLVLNGSQPVVYYYDAISRKQNSWITLDTNPLIEAVLDMNGAEFVADSNNAQESLFADFMVTNINATRVQHLGDIGLLYSNHITVYGSLYDHIYMHRTAGLRVLVPRFDLLKPNVLIQIDPYDGNMWMAYGVLILAFAFLRMCCSRRFGCQQYAKSLKDIVACVILSSPIVFHRLLEQLILGAFQLLNMLLMTVYESLVISLFLNPRFYPELDTLEQVNDSCCWAQLDYTRQLNFRHYGDCLSVLLHEGYVPSVRDQGRFECYLINATYEKGLTDFMATKAVSKHYRWSKLQLQSYPVMASAFGSVGLVQRINFYAGVFFAEGALYKAFEAVERSSERENPQVDKAVTTEDLLLLCKVYCGGIGLSVAAFAGELMVYIVKQMLQWKAQLVERMF